ncbi:MAG: hypothetical protein J6V55_06825 [Alistipes sp.]|nr:hypothetical protein [Alistipes sp.]
MKIKTFTLFTNVVALMVATMLFGCNEPNTPTPTPQPEQKAFKFSGVVSEHRTLKVNVIPEDKEQEYIVFLSEKKHFTANQIDTREELLEDDYIYFTQLAEYYEMGVYEFLKTVGWVATGDKIGYGAINLYPDTEYVIYCYGVQFDGDFYEATTEICYKEISTTSPELVNADFDLNVGVAGNLATISIDPKEYDGYYYSFVVPETDSYYLYDGMEFSDEYMAHYRNMLVDEFDEASNEGTAISSLCHQGKVEFNERLEPNKEYVLLVFNLSDDKMPIINSLPVVERFTTQEVSTSDLTIDIAVTDITPYMAHLTVTPSNESESYACLVLGKDQVPPIENEYEQMLTIMEYYGPAIFRGTHNEDIYPFTPSTEYVVLAFGVENNLPTTQLFRHDFTTASADAGNITIESIDIVKLFDAQEIVALDRSYAQALSECECVAIVEMTTSAPTDNVYFWWYEEWNKAEYSEEAFLEDLLMYEPTSTMTAMNMYYSLDESDKFFFAGIAEDENGNLSAIYYSEPFLLTKDMCDPAEEFFREVL